MKGTTLRRLRQVLWIYFWLLIFEGALRKWILPGLANPLLLVRDPVALLCVWWGWPILRQRGYQIWMQPLLVIGSIAFALAITVGHGDIPTALYGARILLLQLPLIFLYGTVFNRGDVIRFAWTFLWISIPMTVLLVAQSNLPDSHFLNVAPGGEGTASFSGALGRSRPPGLFTFITGVVSFYSLAASCMFILLYSTRLNIPGRLVCTVAGMALVVALPVSISRSLLAGYMLVLVAAITALALSRTRILPLVLGLLAVAMAIALATTIPAFHDTSAAFMARWEGAGVVDRSEEGDLGIASYQFQQRILPGFTTPLSNLDSLPLLGYGIGMGTNVGARRLSGQASFLLGEGGWDVTMGELGVFLGLAFIFWRIGLTAWMLNLALFAAVRGNPLPLILLGSSIMAVLNGQLSQPTGLGFLVLSGGLTLAALNPGSVYRPSQVPKAPNLLPS
jgi:hypothetical protein